MINSLLVLLLSSWAGAVGPQMLTPADLSTGATYPIAIAGNAASATRLNAAPTTCTGQAATGVDASGNAVGCFSASGTDFGPSTGTLANVKASTGTCVLPNVLITASSNSVVCAEPSNTSGQSATALALAAAGSVAPSGFLSRGVDASGNNLPAAVDATTNGVSSSTKPWSSGAAAASIALLAPLNNAAMTGTFSIGGSTFIVGGGSATVAYQETVGSLKLGNVATGTQCLHEISGIVSGTGSDCGSGGAGETNTYGQDGSSKTFTQPVLFKSTGGAVTITGAGGLAVTFGLTVGSVTTPGFSSSSTGTTLGGPALTMATEINISSGAAFSLAHATVTAPDVMISSPGANSPAAEFQGGNAIFPVGVKAPFITGTQCWHSVNGVLSGTGSDCGSGGGGAFVNTAASSYTVMGPFKTTDTITDGGNLLIATGFGLGGTAGSTTSLSGWMVFIDSTMVSGTTDTRKTDGTSFYFSTYTVLANTLHVGDEIEVECMSQNSSAGDLSSAIEFIDAPGSLFTAEDFLSFSGYADRLRLHLQVVRHKAMFPNVDGLAVSGNNGGGYSTNAAISNNGVVNQMWPIDETVNNTFRCGAESSGGGTVNFLWMKLSKR